MVEWWGKLGITLSQACQAQGAYYQAVWLGMGALAEKSHGVLHKSQLLSGTALNCEKFHPPYLCSQSRNELDLMEAVATLGPISVAVDAGGGGLSGYQYGRRSGSCPILQGCLAGCHMHVKEATPTLGAVCKQWQTDCSPAMCGRLHPMPVAQL